MVDKDAAGMPSGPIFTAEEYGSDPRGTVETELVEGRIVSVTPLGFRRGVVAARIRNVLERHAILNDLGTVVGPEAGYTVARDPDTVRRAEAGFFSKARVLREGSGRHPLSGPPDLTVRVVRRDEDSNETRRWIDAHLHDAAGRLLWELRPDEGHWIAHSAGGSRTWGVDDVVSGGDALPGLEIVVREILG